MKECVKCGSTKNLTKDHIIPKWIYKRSGHFDINFKKNLGKKNTQIMCLDCNVEKSGYIDCSTEMGRDFWTKIRDRINEELCKE